MKRYQITITGQTPLLMHADDVLFRDRLKAFQKNPDNKKKSVAGDDRTPAFTWIGYMYAEAGRIVMPSDNLMTMMREGGKRCPTGKKQETFMRLTQSGIVVDQSAWPVLVDGGEVSTEGIDKLAEDADFEAHMAWARERGFELFVKGAKVGMSKHIRVRPRFDRWQLRGTLTVLEPDMISTDSLQNILDMAGSYAGLGNWRPSSPSRPGSFGRFTAKIESVK
jgi:predicted RNA-binding protein with TRAM domain